jgi:hypothetical protein
MIPPSTFASSFTPPAQQPAPKSAFSFSAPTYTPPVSAPSPTFVASSLKQPILPNPPPQPPRSHRLLKYLIILIVLVGIGFGIYFFRLQIINLWNTSSIGANLQIRL